MEVKEIIAELGFQPSDFESDGKIYVYRIPNSNQFSQLYGLLDDSDVFEEDLDAQDINLFMNKLAFVDVDGEVEIDLIADFNKDEYTLTLTEV